METPGLPHRIALVRNTTSHVTWYGNPATFFFKFILFYGCLACTYVSAPQACLVPVESEEDNSSPS